QRSNCQHLLDGQENKRVPEKHLLCFIGFAKAFDCGSQQTVENSSRNGNTRQPYLAPEKSVCKSSSSS
ncbi:hypothetical protein LC916_15345, partial [Enterococcus faecium]|nr:hypothetical protein [Enterococcus faecium]